jgi:hypothetical protein
MHPHTELGRAHFTSLGRRNLLKSGVFAAVSAFAFPPIGAATASSDPPIERATPSMDNKMVGFMLPHEQFRAPQQCATATGGTLFAS